MDFQLKATSRMDVRHADHVAFPISRKNYDDLRATERQSPVFLAVLLMRDDERDWVGQSPEEILLRGRLLYTSLRLRDAIETDSVTIHLPYAGELSHAELKALMVRVDGGAVT